MAMTPYAGDTDIIAALGTTPQERGLETAEFKAKFDEGLAAFVTWFNATHLPEVPFVETGTFTPTVAGSTVEGSNSYNYQLGVYRVIGGRVFADIAISMTTKDASMAGNISVKGLPFAPKYLGSMRYAVNVSMCDAVTGGIYAVFPVATTELQLYKFGTSTRVQAADIGTPLWLVLHTNYEKA